MGRILCWIGQHAWNYSGNAHTHAPAPVRCTRCGTTYGRGKGGRA